jgi:hypothetical protein
MDPTSTLARLKVVAPPTHDQRTIKVGRRPTLESRARHERVTIEHEDVTVSAHLSARRHGRRPLA